MTEDKNDQTNEGPMGESHIETAPAGMPETTSQARRFRCRP